MCRTKYKGEKGELVRVEYVDGKIDHFKGEKGEEQLVRVEYAVGRVEHYKAKKGKLRLVRVENAVGQRDADAMRAEAMRAEAAVNAREQHRTDGAQTAEAEDDLQGGGEMRRRPAARAQRGSWCARGRWPRPRRPRRVGTPCRLPPSRPTRAARREAKMERTASWARMRTTAP